MRKLFEDIAAYREAYVGGAAIPIQETGGDEPLPEDDDNYEPGHHYGFEVTPEQQKELDDLLAQIEELESKYGPHFFILHLYPFMLRKYCQAYNHDKKQTYNAPNLRSAEPTGPAATPPPRRISGKTKSLSAWNTFLFQMPWVIWYHFLGILVAVPF